MVRWYHAIFSAYGFWLPNDPRGSWSTWVHSWDLFYFGGPATTVNGKRSYAHDPHDVRFRREMKEHLKYPAVRFEEHQQVAIGRGIRRACGEGDILVHACAIGFDHVHVITARHESKTIEDVVAHFNSAATKQMNLELCHPLSCFVRGSRSAPTPWGVGRWSVFINDEEQLHSAIAYVERHPIKEGRERQRWSFVKPV